ncbi:MAG: Stk1 family PASTA domain-containing Ser/Thr kinase, partial [Lachnospiraceae bacterium]|nr:Stk1 family PASTA domain-containing Ser/Thr kinase [Lachnospiraceae bacterium]
MIKLGMLLGDRYEVIEKIGTGGMSDVYKAKDHKLNRYVAVKVLKQEFSENANFVSKFIVEAQAAAGLMHPNIVNVYDVGEEAGIHYIIMELVEGITLKKYIEKKARLSFKEAVSIAIQVSMGIEAAHNNHIIHRDIKPQNIIISKEGKVKVTDFGIAKAATSNTVTSNVMGSVHYTSPEQARGGYSDEKSDVYSLGITLFEMLTGRVPFDGETTVAIAIKHIQEPMPSPRDYISEIPVSVEQIVLKCCQKPVDRRYQSMAALIEDLKQALLNPDEDFVQIADPAEAGATRMINANGWTDEFDEEPRYHTRHTGRTAHTTGTLKLRTDRIPEELLEEEEEVEAHEWRVEKVTTAVMVVIGILIVCMIVFLASKILGFFDNSDNGEYHSSQATSESLIETGTVSKVEMPAVIGEKEEKMIPILRAKGLEVRIFEEESLEYNAGIILYSDVEAGTILKEGDVVTITVSTGAGAIEIESVVGKS